LIMYSSRWGSPEIGHLGPTHCSAEAELVKAADVTTAVPIVTGGQ